ncbi:MAG: TonB-dependent receptor [Alphaproteobacteria bacterium]|nr:MAG: TonB-dependent receptor [Caulobacteraceae bacterium]TPW05965.1 MAG: TonB-dependent receptor [Alphaproteobacteria bacterium]
MKQDTKRDRLFATTFFAGLALAMPAVAQQATTPAAPEEETDAIIVTGSRIPQRNLETTNPITQLTAEDLSIQGATRVEDLTNQLPQVFATQGSAVANGASGTAEVSLRGLGAGRTLVLIDGVRMPYGSDTSSAADLNTIPGAMIERVEVLTGGASAVYGSDAVSGVVNFIMRDNYEGLRVDAQYGFYQHENDTDQGDLRNTIQRRGTTNAAQFRLPDDSVVDGYGKEVSLIFGASSPDGRGNVTAYATYRTNDAVLQKDRDYSACSLGAGLNGVNRDGTNIANSRPGQPANTLYTCGGSGTSYPGLFLTQTGNFTIDTTTGNTFRPFANATDQYNFGPLNYYQRPDERYALGAFAHYEISDNIEAYAQLMFSNYKSTAQIAPSGNFFSTATLNCGNPLFGPGMATAFGCSAADIAADTPVSAYIARRNVEGGGRQDTFDNTSYRMVTGLRGDLGESGWSYDVTAMYAKTDSSRAYLNEFSVTRLTRALDVVDTDPGAGVTAACRSAVNGTDTACVPWNVFQIGGVTQAALDYLQVPLLRTGETEQQILTASVAGALPITSPFAETPISLALGIEYRRDYMERITDVSFQTGDGAGQGGPTLGFKGAANDVTDLFAETQIMVAENQPFAHQISIDASYRHSSYGTGTKTETYGFGADWAPVEDIRFRGSYAQAVRAPNIIELFSAQGPGLFDMADDPCDQNDPASDGIAPAAACIGANPWQTTLANASSATFSSPAGQYNGLFGGNPNVGAEEGKTKTYGFVFQPSMIEGLSLSVDYFDIEVTNLISNVGAATTVSRCFSATPNLASCALITRNPNNGTLWLGAGIVSDLQQNTTGALTTSGYDFNAAYNFDIGSLGGMSVSLLATKLEEYNGGCEGLYGAGLCGTPNPEWRGRFRATWTTPWDLELNGTIRYFGSVDYAGTTATTAPDYSLDSQTYLDIAGNYQMFDNTRFRAGINNVLDREPPLSRFTGAGFGNGNTYPQVYDALGRWVFMGITVDF